MIADVEVLHALFTDIFKSFKLDHRFTLHVYELRDERICADIYLGRGLVCWFILTGSKVAYKTKEQQPDGTYVGSSDLVDPGSIDSIKAAIASHLQPFRDTILFRKET